MRKDGRGSQANHLTILILVLPLVLIQTVSAAQVVFAEQKSYVISAGSMEPTLKVNDIVVADTGVPFEDLREGDIIIVKKPDGSDRTIVHRVVAIDTDPEGNIVITTKGDANPGPIPGTDFPITSGLYIGKVVNIIPEVGVILKIISPPVNYIIGAAIIGGIAYGVHRYRKKKRKDVAKPDT